MKRSDLAAAAAVIRSGRSFVLAGHTNPDGDCLGSIAGMSVVLSGMGKRVSAVVPEGVPELYKFLPGAERMIAQPPHDERFDVGIAFDSDRQDRLGPAAQIFDRCDQVVVLDHHVGCEWNKGILLVDSTKASCGEIVYCLIRELGAPVTREVAESLLTAIVTDTGSFRYSNVKAETLRIAADLVEAGGVPGTIVERVYESRSLASAKALGKALTNLQITDVGRISYTFLTRQDIEEAGAADADTEGIVNVVRSIRGARVGIFFREVSTESTRVSLRSTGGEDVSAIAKEFGGGGHKAAAGCTVEKPVTQAIEAVLDSVRQCMAS